MDGLFGILRHNVARHAEECLELHQPYSGKLIDYTETGYFLIFFGTLYCLRFWNPLKEDYELHFNLDPKLFLDVQSTAALWDQSQLLRHIKINMFHFNCWYAWFSEAAVHKAKLLFCQTGVSFHFMVDFCLMHLTSILLSFPPPSSSPWFSFVSR